MAKNAVVRDRGGAGPRRGRVRALSDRIRNDPRWAALPVILLSDRDDPDMILSGLEAGADALISRHSVPGDLVERVRQVTAAAVSEKTGNDRGRMLVCRLGV